MDISTWAQPPTFFFHNLVRSTLSTQCHWQQTLCSLRLTSKAWRQGASQAVEVLSPRPGVRCDDLFTLPQAFPNLQVLRLEHPVIVFDVSDVLDYLGPLLPSLRVLLAQGCSGLAVNFSQLSSLCCLELQGDGGACYVTQQRARMSPLALGLTRMWFRCPSGDALGPHMLSNAALFTNLRSLHCPAGNTQPATPAHVAGLSVLTHLTSLTLTCLARQAVPALADLAGGSLAGTLRCLAFSLDPREGGEQSGEEGLPLAQLLPLSSLGRLTALGTPWELFRKSLSSDCTHLVQLASLSVDFHCLDMDDPNLFDGTCCMLFLSGLRNLRHLCLSNGGSYALEECLLDLRSMSALASLTSLELESMFYIEPNVMAEAIGALGQLRQLRMQVSCSQGGALREALVRLSRLTQLELLNCGIHQAQSVAEAAAAASALRHLHLRGWPAMTQEALEQILLKLPGLELLQTDWKPQAEGSAALCEAWRHVLRHSLDVPKEEHVTVERGWAEFDAAEALRDAGVAL